MEILINEVRNKKKPYEGKYDNWELVKKMMDTLDLNLISDEKDYNGQKCKPSIKKVSFSRKDDKKQQIFRCKLLHIKSGSSRGLSDVDKSIIYKNQGEIQKIRQPIRSNNYNMLEKRRIENLFNLFDIAIKINEKYVDENLPYFLGLVLVLK